MDHCSMLFVHSRMARHRSDDPSLLVKHPLFCSCALRSAKGVLGPFLPRVILTSKGVLDYKPRRHHHIKYFINVLNTILTSKFSIICLDQISVNNGKSMGKTYSLCVTDELQQMYQGKQKPLRMC